MILEKITFHGTSRPMNTYCPLEVETYYLLYIYRRRVSKSYLNVFYHIASYQTHLH